MPALDTTFLGNTLESWLIALGVLVATRFALGAALRLAARRLRGFSEATDNVVDDVVSAVLARTTRLFLWAIAIWAGSRFLDLPARADAILRQAALVVVAFQGGLWAVEALTTWLRLYAERRASEDPAALTSMSAVGFLGRLVIWSVVLLVALDNVGIDVTALVASLGIGGIAVALAVQNILGDLFASLSIVLDKPFVIGDFLIIGDFLGSVEKIGLKTTRVRSLSGEQLIFSNSDLLSARVRNYGRMFERRVVFTVGLVYQTSPEGMEAATSIIREAVEAEERTRFDRCHFKAFGDFALQIETVYYVLLPDYNVYMDIQQAINLTIMRRFREEGLEFAYPTQQLYVDGRLRGSAEAAGEPA